MSREKAEARGQELRRSDLVLTRQEEQLLWKFRRLHTQAQAAVLSGVDAMLNATDDYTKPDHVRQTEIGFQLLRAARMPNRIIGIEHSHETALRMLTAMRHEGLI